MKKLFVLLIALIVSISSVIPTYAADSKVTYSDNAGEFIFEPGSKHSPTDLFPDFKGVMPGDVLTQKITVKNDADHGVKVNIYLRALGAQEGSEEFLSQLKLRVEKSEDNEVPYMFDAAANETAQLTEWVLLGSLYSGGEVNLDVILEVPVELDNKYQNAIGYLDWEFRVDEFPIGGGGGSNPPKPGETIVPDESPNTGDNSNPGLWLSLALIFACFSLVIFILAKKKNKNYKKIALAFSLCALILWGFLGTGASIAWFVDTSPNINNIFHFADFDLVVSHRLTDGKWEEIDSQTKIFDEKALYEPGYVQVVYLKVENKGSVPFNFKTAVNVTDYTTVKNVFGQEFTLKDYLKFGLVIADSEATMKNSVEDRNAAKEIANRKLNSYATNEQILGAGKTAYVALVVRMPEEVTNIANYRGDEAPRVELGVIVTAEQVRE